MIQAEISNRSGVITRLRLKQYQTSLPVTDIMSIKNFSNMEFVLTEKTDLEIVLSHEDDNYRVERRYALLPNEYLIHAQINIKQKALMSKEGISFIDGFKRIENLVHIRIERTQGLPFV